MAPLGNADPRVLLITVIIPVRTTKVFLRWVVDQ